MTTPFGCGRGTVAFCALVGIVLLAGCAAPMGEPGRTDPATDRLGWEAGYWHDDPIAVNNTDGLTEAERTRLVARTMARIELVRGLEFERQVPVEIVPRTALEQFDRTVPPTERRLTNGRYEALMLVGEDRDAAASLQSLLQQGTGGFYETATDRLVVIADSPTPQLHGERVLAHELTHALQDQHFDLDVTANLTDADMAVRGTIEGDATVVEQAYLDRCGGEWACLQGPPRNVSGTAGLSQGLALLFTFPYAEGVDFAAARKRADGWAGVDATLAAMPSTSATTIHPERYGSGPPRSVRLPDTSTPAWTPVSGPNVTSPDRLGEGPLAAAFVHTVLDTHNPATVVPPDAVINRDGLLVNTTDPLDFDINYTSGWAGDALRVYHDGADLAYVLKTAWASEAQAAEFARGYRRLLRHWGGARIAPGTWRLEGSPYADAFRLSVRGSTVTVVNAPTRAALDAVHDAGGE